MKSKRMRTSSYLPDECWESIFKFIIEDCNNNYNYNNKLNNSYLNSLSLVSNQFLSITNRLMLSFCIRHSTDIHGLFKRFTNLNSLYIKTDFLKIDLDTLLNKISCLPLKLTSLKISYQHNIPPNGLRAFSKKITTLTSFTCFGIGNLKTSDLVLIAECFPLLEELDLSYPLGRKDYSSYVNGVEALSLALIKLRKVNLSGFPINDQSLYHLFHNCKHLEEVIMFGCDQISSTGIACALRERPTLRSFSFSHNKNLFSKVLFHTTDFINSLVSLKGLTYLHLHDLFISDEHVVQLSSLLPDLVSIDLSCCHQLTKSALFTLAKNCPSLSEIKMERIRSTSVQNSDSLVEFGVYPQLKSLYLGDNSWLSDESIIMFASNFPNLQLLDLNDCHNISEGICQVLRKCCKIRHLNLANCPKMKLLGLNFVVPNLEVLNLSWTKVDDETLYVISKNCCGLLQLILVNCNGFTKKGVKHVVENCSKLRNIMVSCYSLSDKNRKRLSRHGCQILNS